MWRAIAPSRHIYSSMIKLENIEKSYNGEPVLRGVSLEIADGEFISVMGESGSGKSTLLGVLGGFITPDGGTVLWNGENIADFSEARTAQFRCRDMGFVFQSFRLISTLTARENIMLPAMVAGNCGRDMQDYMRQICERLGIESMLDKYPEKLSGGQRQRTAIARALCFRPHTVVLDEPTGALDSAMQQRVMQLLREVNAGGTTIIQVTHSAAMAECGGRTVRIKDGVICG